ncbi:MAG: hypothetical protein NE334_19400 [Lentisphaeraceae bacterium]|nr:hypothetical protein [Lentisphaeraceae bacterium]
MWFKQLNAVFKNAFKVGASDPFYLVISLALVLLMALAASMPSIGDAEHTRMVRDQTHSIIFICGALAGAFGLIRVVTDDIRRGAGAILMSRPISGTVLILGKLLGVLACVAILVTTGAAAYLWISEIAHDHEFLNTQSLVIYIVAIILALCSGAARQYMFGSNFSLYTSLSLCVLMLLGVGFRVAISGKGDFDFLGLQSCLLLFMALVTFCATVQVLAVIADSALVFGGAIIVFFLGLISTYLTTNLLGDSFGQVIGAILPNWQLFWILESIGLGQNVSISYFVGCAVQMLLYVGLYVMASISLFERTEIKGVT